MHNRDLTSRPTEADESELQPETESLTERNDARVHAGTVNHKAAKSYNGTHAIARCLGRVTLFLFRCWQEKKIVESLRDA
jgi:hypothetical protein